MDVIKSILSNQIFWGFIIGFTLCVIAMVSLFKTKMELRRLKGHLSDKLELEAEKLTAMKAEIENLKGENENLRMKINSGRVQNDKVELDRNLEIYARAEKTMVVSAPGFAPAWETAKEKAIAEMEEEERGKSVPKKIFNKLIGTSGRDSAVVEALPGGSDGSSD